jgi:uncharacterized protein (DUF433 family)
MTNSIVVPLNLCGTSAPPQFTFSLWRAPTCGAVTCRAWPHAVAVSYNPRPIVRTANVCGGRARIAGTRIAVWVLESLYQQGASVDEIHGMYQHLSREQILDALDYAADNSNEIEGDISAHENG